MNINFKGKTVLVTGASKGIGFSIASGFAEAQASVLAVSRTKPASLPADVTHLSADLTDPKKLSSLAADVAKSPGRLDVLVLNLGSGRSVPALTEDATEWDRMLRLNLTSAALTLTAFRDLLAASHGAVVFISSLCGLEASGAPSTYTAAKAALNAYAKAASRELGKSGIRVNVVCPGNILFPGSVWERKQQENAAAVTAMLNQEVPLARFGRPDEIANAALFLASDAAAFITGAVLTVDGGQTRGF